MDGRNSNTDARRSATQENPHLRNLERSPYELGDLLRSIPNHFLPGVTYTDDVYLKVDAASRHAGNGCDTVLHGLEAIGRLMFSAATNENYPCDAQTWTDLGGLVRHLAVEAQFLSEIIGEATDLLHHADVLASQKGGA